MVLDSAKELFEKGLIWQAENADSFSLAQQVYVKSEGLKTTISKQTSKNKVGTLGIAQLDSSLPSGGWKKGAIHEFYYSEKKFSSPPIIIPTILASQSSEEIFWIGKQSWPTPFLLERIHFPNIEENNAGHNNIGRSYRDHCFFLDPKDRKSVLWSIETILRDVSNSCVIADCSLLNFTLSRRLALAAESSNSILILLREKKHARTPSSAITRWEISQVQTSNEHPCWQLDLLQCRGKEPHQKTWIIEERHASDEYPRQKISLHLSEQLEGISKRDNKARAA